MTQLPILRIEIDHMRAGITAALNARHQDLLACANAGIDAAIADLPRRLAMEAKKMSEEIMNEALRIALEEYWKQGQGRDMIDSMIMKKFKTL